MENIKEKIKKLFALAGSDNENEAALALKNAERLMRKHNLEMTDLADDISITKMSFHEGRLMGYKHYLSMIVAELFFCRVGTSYSVYSDKKSHNFIGTQCNVNTAEEVYRRLLGWVDYKGRMNYPVGNVAKRNEYRNGLVAGIVRRVYDILEERQQEENANALVVVSDAIDEYTKDFGTAREVGPMRRGEETARGINDAIEAPIFQEVY